MMTARRTALASRLNTLAIWLCAAGVGVSLGDGDPGRVLLFAAAWVALAGASLRPSC